LVRLESIYKFFLDMGVIFHGESNHAIKDLIKFFKITNIEILKLILKTIFI